MSLTDDFEVHSERPAAAGPEHLIIRIGVVREGPGGCSVTVESPGQSSLVDKYEGVARALAACRNYIIKDLDAWIEQATNDGL